MTFDTVRVLVSPPNLCSLLPGKRIQRFQEIAGLGGPIVLKQKIFYSCDSFYLVTLPAPLGITVKSLLTDTSLKRTPL